ncbi:MAG TPA: arsinothricin resistance N-acetyltransferase ArsN1 family B [Caulobacteraceae bacterium]|nr:arsinothricin resistance N-acetyltransferase ArsN1 family B [Caulobacteraceae bacterium]
MIVRTARIADAAAVAAIYAPIVRETAISFEIEPPTAAEIAGRIETTLATHPWLVAEADGMVAGYAYASPHQARGAYRWSVNTTVYVAEGRRGAGVGRTLYGSLIPTLRRQGFRSAFAGIALPNEASVALHEAVGFEALGVYREVGFKFSRWHDVGWWRLGLSDDDRAPAEPTAFSAL